MVPYRASNSALNIKPTIKADKIAGTKYTVRIKFLVFNFRFKTSANTNPKTVTITVFAPAKIRVFTNAVGTVFSVLTSMKFLIPTNFTSLTYELQSVKAYR